MSQTPPANPHTPSAHSGLLMGLVRLARPHQWVKGAFVLIGPVYGHALAARPQQLATLGTLAAFALASSACYIINDLRDAPADRNHPRKRHRPIASGQVPPATALAFALVLAAAAASALALVARSGMENAASATLWTGVCIAAYVANVLLYSVWSKHVIILDVMALALGFVLRVLGGCAAVLVEPSSWLLNVTFFIAMFLAFGKRLGERRVMGEESVAQVRVVQARYTEDLLRMVVVVTGVATLLTYAGYVIAQGPQFTRGFNLLWLTMLPATYALLRCIVLLEQGTYDDPTELATRDRPFQIAALCFALLTLALLTRIVPMGA